MAQQGPRQRGGSGTQGPASAVEANVENEEQRVDAMLASLARGGAASVAWEDLHGWARSGGRQAQLAVAFDSVAQGRRMKTVQPATGAEFFYQAARLYSDVFGDDACATTYLERALSLVPGHAAAFALLESLLAKVRSPRKLAELYSLAAQHRPRADQAPLLRKAVDLLQAVGDSDEKVVELLQQVVRLDPADEPSRSRLEALFLKANRFRDAVRLCEQALAADPTPPPRARLLGRIVELYAEKLQEPERSLPHAEQLLLLDPTHEGARQVAQRLVSVKGLAGRAAAALATAFESAGTPEQVAHYLTLELENTRGPKRATLLARLGRLREDRMGDDAGAFEVFEQALALDPEDDVRSRYVALATKIQRHAEAAKTLVRVLSTLKDPAVRAKTNAELGELWLRSGDAKRAKATLCSVLSAPEAGPEAVLAAASSLREIYEGESDNVALCDVLERIASIEPDTEKRQEVDECLSTLAMSTNDVARAIAAFERLLTTRGRAKALLALDPLYETTGALRKQAGLLEERAKAAGEDEEARALLLRAANVRTRDPDDPSAAIATCDALIERFGATRDVLAMLVPLLERHGLWSHLARALALDAGLSEGPARAQALVKLGCLQAERLHDAAGAIKTMGAALAFDAEEPTARATLEELASAGAHRLEASRVLEPVYRREGARPQLLLALELRGTLAPTLDERLEALGEAADDAAGGGADPAQARKLVARGLGEAVAGDRALGVWLERLERVTPPGTDPARRAEVLSVALGEREVTTDDLSVLAKQAADSLVVSGDAARAIGIYRRALAFEPHSTDLLAKIDELLRGQGSPSERVALYRATLTGADAARRQTLLHRIGAIERHDLGDVEAAIETYRAALADDPGDAEAHARLEELFVLSDRASDLCSLLENHLLFAKGGSSRTTRVKLVRLSAARGDAARAGLHGAHLIDDPSLTGEELCAVEAAAEQLDDSHLARAALNRRVENAAVPAERIGWLEQLGILDHRRRQDPEAAAASWKRAGELAEAISDDEGARRLYARARKVAPEDGEVAARLCALCERAGLWDELPPLYAALADQSGDDSQRADLALRAARVFVDRLGQPEAAARYVARAFELSPGRADVLDLFEKLSVAAGAVEAFEQTLGDVLSRPGPPLLAIDQHLNILLARARALASDPARADDAALVYRTLLSDERFGEARWGDALRLFEALAADHGVPAARRADRQFLLQWRAEHTQGDARTAAYLAWALEEETSFGDAERALALYRLVLEAKPDSEEALSSVARLALLTGDVHDALAALSARCEQTEGPARLIVRREIARVLLERTDRAGEALSALEAILSEAPTDAASLLMVTRLMGHPETHTGACALLERACDATGDASAQAQILECLLATPVHGGNTSVRRAWFERLCEIRCADRNADGALSTAVRAIREMPSVRSLWDRAEDLARRVSRADEMANLYEDVLALPLPREEAVSLGERAVRFYEEWFDDSTHVVRILERVLDIDPTAAWAFDRLKLLLDAAERWDDLFGLYDRALAAARAEDRARLLEDAAQTAKDFADRPDRAVFYLERLRELRPNDPKLTSALERLYERQGKPRELVQLLSEKLPSLDGEEARRTRVRMTRLWLDALSLPTPALEVLEPLLEQEAGADKRLPADAVLLLEQIVESEGRQDGPRAKPPRGSERHSALPASTRLRAAAWLREHYAACHEDKELARVLLVELDAMTRPKDRMRRHAEVAALYEGLGDVAGAFDQTCIAVLEAPDDASVRERLADLGERSGRLAQLSDVMRAVAAAAEPPSLRALLTMQAATLCANRLGDVDGAIALLTPLLDDPTVESQDAVEAARRLEPLLEAAGRVEDQLDALERIAALTRDPGMRRETLGRAGLLAASLQQHERSSALWQTRLGMDEGDREALDRLVDVLSRLNEHERLATVLSLRAKASLDGVARHEDLLRLASLLSDVLERRGQAIDTWTAIEREFGAGPETTQALATLFRETGRWDELAALLDRLASDTGTANESTQASTRAETLAELGNVRREHLDDARGAVHAYARALAADARASTARAGLVALANADMHRSEAVDTLLRALRASDDWASILDLTELRLLAAPAASGAAEDLLPILLETALIAEQRAGDPRRAFEVVRRAFVLAPGDAHVHTEVARLAGRVDAWRETVEAHLEAIAGAARNDGRLVSELWTCVGRMREARLNDAAGALDAYLEAMPGSTEAGVTLAVMRVAAFLGRWHVAASAFVELARKMETAALEALSLLEPIAAAASAWDFATSALEEAIATEGLRGPAARDALGRLAEWHRDRRGDAERAERAIENALNHDPSSAPLLGALVALRRSRPNHRLIDALVAESAARGGRLSILREACEVALVLEKNAGSSESTGDKARAHGLARDLAATLLGLARTRWQERSGEAREVAGDGGSEDASNYAEWAVETLAKLYDQAGDARELLDVLVTGEALPFDAATRLSMRRRAALVAQDRLDDPGRAISLHEPIFEQDPSDAQAAERLAFLYASTGRTRDLLRLRQRQIEVASGPLERIGLRLDAAALLWELGETQNALDTLRANLNDDGAHEETVEKLSEALSSVERHEELRELVCLQAIRAEDDGDRTRAADYWSRAAGVAEHCLKDAGASARYHERVVALEPRTASLETLARLSEARADHEAAAGWLVRWLDAAPSQIVDATLRLADALVASGHPDRAAAHLERSLIRAPEAEPLRARVESLYRERSDWPNLARSIADAAAHAPDKATRMARLRTAADLFSERCGQPDRAVPLLEQAADLAPDDAMVRLALADALARAGREGDARSILRSMIDAFGGRRPRARAAVHYQMARLELGAGNRATALVELDAASRVDPQNAEILRTLAALARDDGQLERAEKSYRALLVVLRRRDEVAEPTIARSEVLLELSAIADARGETDRAREIVESAVEAATESDFEQEQMQAGLRGRGDYSTLVRILELRVARLGNTPEVSPVLGELADILANRLGRAEEALSARMRSVQFAPRSGPAHDAAIALARSMGQVDRYVVDLCAWVDAAIASSDTALATELLGRLARVAEADLRDDVRAASYCERAQALGDPATDLLLLQAAVYERLGRVEDQAKTLALHIEAERRNGGSMAGGDAFYRLAALHLGRPDTLDQGVEMLGRAMDLQPSWDVAERAVAAALAIAPTHAGALDLYERIGRQPGHHAALVETLCLRARIPGAGHDVVREAVLAASLAGNVGLAESLLESHARAQRQGAKDGPNRDSGAGLSWTLEAMSKLRDAAGDVRGALALKREAAENADPSSARRILFEVSRIAIDKLGDLSMAAEVLEALRRSDPSDRSVWEELAQVYRRGGEARQLADLLASVTDHIDDAAERATLRFERVRTMVGSLDLGDGDALPLLREIVEEDPSQVDAALMLAAILERSGANEELASLLARQMEAGKDRGDAPSIASLALRLGALLETTDRAQARTVYYAGLDWDGSHKGLLDSVLRLLDAPDDAGERADVLERRLILASGPEAESMAQSLRCLRADAFDDVGAERALALGFRAHPQSDAMRAPLEETYRKRGDWQLLAELCMTDAASRTEVVERIARWREAASIYRSELASPAAAATAVGLARAHAADDWDLLRDHVALLVEAGDFEAARAELSRALDADGTPSARRAALLATRAGLGGAGGDHEHSLSDLEAAFAIDPETYGNDLANHLGRAHDDPRGRGALGEAVRRRDLTVRRAEVLRRAGDADGARGLLGELIHNDPKDPVPLKAFAELEGHCGRWEAASAAWRTLVGLEEGEAVVSAALSLAEACEQAGRGGDARGALEHALLVAPSDRAVRGRLERLYEATGAWKELAELARADAASSADVAERFSGLVRAGSWLLRDGGDASAAAHLLVEALALRPTDLGCVALLTDAFLGSGRVLEAKAVLESGIAAQKGRRSRELASLYARVSRVERALGNQDAELRALVQALECDSQNGDVCAEVALRAIDRSEFELATRALRGVTLLKVPGAMSKAMAYLHLGQIARTQGDNKRAMALFKRAVAEDPALDAAAAMMTSLRVD